MEDYPRAEGTTGKMPEFDNLELLVLAFFSKRPLADERCCLNKAEPDLLS